MSTTKAQVAAPISAQRGPMLTAYQAAAANRRVQLNIDGALNQIKQLMNTYLANAEKHLTSAIEKGHHTVKLFDIFVSRYELGVVIIGKNEISLRDKLPVGSYANANELKEINSKIDKAIDESISVRNATLPKQMRLKKHDDTIHTSVIITCKPTRKERLKEGIRGLFRPHP